MANYLMSNFNLQPHPTQDIAKLLMYSLRFLEDLWKTTLSVQCPFLVY